MRKLVGWLIFTIVVLILVGALVGEKTYRSWRLEEFIKRYTQPQAPKPVLVVTSWNYHGDDEPGVWFQCRRGEISGWSKGCITGKAVSQTGCSYASITVTLFHGGVVVDSASVAISSLPAGKDWAWRIEPITPFSRAELAETVCW